MPYEIPSEGSKRCMIYRHDPNPVKEQGSDEKEESQESEKSA